MMKLKKISRRDFLRGSAAGLMGVVLSGAFGATLSLAEEDVGGAAVSVDGKRTYLSFGTGTTQELSPFTSSSSGNMVFRRIVYMPLAYDDGEGWLTSDACSSIEMIDEYTWRVTLYEGITDTEGNPFTSADLVWCMDKIKEIGKISYYSVYESAVAEDDLNVVITLNSHLSTAFTDLCNFTLLVTQAAYEASEDEMLTTPVGTTQYRVTEFVPSSYCVYEKIDNYWQTDASKITRLGEANVDVLKLTMLKETTQKVSGLQTGDLQLVNNLTYLNTMTLLNGYTIFEKANASSEECLVFNMSSTGACANDINLRKAILHAVDNEAILAALGGKGEIMYSEVSSTYIGYNEDWLEEDYWVHDVDLAKEYLATSDYNGETLRLLNSTDSNVSTRNEVVLSNLEAIGIKVELNTLDTAAYQSAAYASSDTWDIAFMGMGSNSLLVKEAYVKASSDSFSDIEGTTKYGWDNEELLALGEEVAAIGTENSDELVNQIHEILVENAIMKGAVIEAQYNAAVDTITSVFAVRTAIAANATHFSSDYAVYYD